MKELYRFRQFLAEGVIKEEQMGSYGKFLKVVKSYEDEEILSDFLDSYPKGQDISKSEYERFTEKHLGLSDPEDYRGENWKYIMSENKLLKEDNGIKFINKFNPPQKIIDMYNENPHLKKPLSSLSKYKKIQAIDALATHLSGGQAKRDMIKKEDRFDSSLAEIIEAWADDYYKDSDFFSYGMYVDKDYFDFFNLNKDLLLKKYKKQQIPYNG